MKNMYKSFIEQFKKDEGFTLIEMLLVLLVISVLIILIVPNIAKQSDTVQAKGCEAQIKMVQGQVEAYRIQTGKVPTSVQQLVPEYLNESQVKCKDGTEIIVNSDGEVTSG